MFAPVAAMVATIALGRWTSIQDSKELQLYETERFCWRNNSTFGGENSIYNFPPPFVRNSSKNEVFAGPQQMTSVAYTDRILSRAGVRIV